VTERVYVYVLSKSGAIRSVHRTQESAREEAGKDDAAWTCVMKLAGVAREWEAGFWSIKMVPLRRGENA
jgi:hypothetical protein